MKKIVAGLIAIVLLVISPISMEQSFAEDGTGESDEMTAISEENLTVKGMDSFGEMLASSLSDELDEQDSNNGCNIFSIEVQGKKAEVSFETVQDATLVVGIYDENGMAMLGTGKLEVTVEETKATVSIDISSMPQYFYLKGFLVDSDTLRPLCTVYESPNYTKEMQDFFAKTTDDFDTDKVLNLDSDKNNNFAVYSDEVTIISDSGITVESADEEANIYVFKNADSIAALKAGDMFSYQCADGSVLVVKVDQIQTDGNTVTVTGIDTSMEEAFEYVKIDTTSDMSDVAVDDSVCGEGVVYNGIADDSGETKGLRAVEGEGKYGKSLSYTFLEDKSHGIAGDVNLNLEASIKVYISWSSQYIEAKIDYSAKAKVKISDKDERKLPLGFVGIRPLPGVYIEFTPSFVTKVSASVEISGDLKGAVGFRATGGKGIENISKAPHFESKLKGEFTVFIGLSMEPKIKIVSDNFANASLDVLIGAEVKGIIKNEKVSAVKIHECKACVDGDIFAKAELKFKTELLNSDKLTFELLVEPFKFKICDWYFSFDFGKFGFTSCPHILYKTTITVNDMMKRPIKGAKVKVPFTVIENDENGKEKRKEISSAMTNEDGKVEGYLKSGKYNVEVTAQKYKKVNKQIVVEDDAKSIGILLLNTINEGGGWDDTKPPVVEPGDEESEVKKVSVLTLGGRLHSGAITEDESLYMWGGNFYGQVGDGTMVNRKEPVKILENVGSVSLGELHSGAVTKDGNLYMWGKNTYGELGDGTTVNREKPVKILENVESVNLGCESTVNVFGQKEGIHSGAITKDGSLYMWGCNSYGELGDGTTVNRDKPVKILENVKSVSLGYDHSGAVTKDGSLYMWGKNYYGELGDGTRVNKNKPVKILENVESVSLGYDHSGAVTKDGCLYMWGVNCYGELGDGTTDNKDKPVKILENVESVSLKYHTSGAVTKDGSLYMWGSNEYGELGDGTRIDQNKPVKILNNVECVSYGVTHMGAITRDGKLYMWGKNSHGAIGLGERPDWKPIKILDNIVSVSLGDNCSGAITKDGCLYMWGYNGNGQLGDGTAISQNKPVKIKIKSKNVDSNSFNTNMEPDNYFSIRGLKNLLPTDATDNDSGQSASFDQLKPNTIYNFYVMKNKDSTELLDISNLLYLSQASSDGSGRLSVSYKPKEHIDDADIFVVAAERDDISSASVNLSDMEYTGSMQYVKPIVTYGGKTLTEFEDYELLGDYSAQDVGAYTVTVHGIGKYKGAVTASYKISEVKSKKVQKISLSIEGIALIAGKMLQLKAEVSPSNAENKILRWTSDNKSVATIDSNGLVTAIGEGKATITASSTDGSNISASCVISVTKQSEGGGSTTPTNPTGPSGPTTPTAPSTPTNSSKPDDIGLETRLLYYIVKFDANGGKNLSRKMMTLLNDDNLGILPKVQRRNYTFSGWYTQKAGGTKVSSSTVLNAGTTLFARWKKVPKPSKVKMSALKSQKSGQLVVNFEKVTGAKGYEIVYSTNKKFTASVTKKIVSVNVNKTLNKLCSGKKYYVRVRAYRLDSAGERVYGSYSMVKNIKVK